MAPERIRSVRRYMLITNIIMLLLGIAFVAWPRESSQMLARVIGIVLLVLSGLCIVLFLLAKSKGITDFMSLIGGVIAGVTGIVFIVNPDLLIGIFNIVFGVVIILVGLANLHQAAFIIRHVRSNWWVSLLVAVLEAGLGVFILLNPFSFTNGLMIWIGIGLMIEALFGFFNLTGLRGKKEEAVPVPDAKDITGDEDVIP